MRWLDCFFKFLEGGWSRSDGESWCQEPKLGLYRGRSDIPVDYDKEKKNCGWIASSGEEANKKNKKKKNFVPEANTCQEGNEKCR